MISLFLFFRSFVTSPNMDEGTTIRKPPGFAVFYRLVRKQTVTLLELGKPFFKLVYFDIRLVASHDT
jgi:hypothetical protein